ncbi:hypothetical protein ACFFKU_06805 [Kineococcus gynurae]|uniref:Uncharacterized protein n=1 Tax=Kineococcus gynurae TaxID=452979 RepID=A0ABV5LX36_9ACTN
MATLNPRSPAVISTPPRAPGTVRTPTPALATVRGTQPAGAPVVTGSGRVQDRTDGMTMIGGAAVYVRDLPGAEWHWSHPFGRLPRIEVYVRDPDSGVLEAVDALVDPTPTDFTIRFSRPVSGQAIVS